MTSPSRLDYQRLGAAVLIPLIAAGLQWLLWPVIQPFIWFLFYPAIFLSAWLGGRWSGILATLFSAGLAIYVFAPPMFSFYLDSPATLFSALAFVGMGFLFSYVFHALKQANRRLDLMAQLQASEASLKQSQAAAQVGHWTWEVRSNRVTWSDEMYRIFGLNPIGFSGDLDDVIRTAVHPDDREKVERANTAVSEAGQPAPLDYRVVWPDGTVRTVYALPAEQVLDEQGHIVRLWGIVQDISARKQAEAALRQSETLFSTVFQVSPVGINLIRLADRRCVQINDAFLDMIGYQRDEVLGRTATELNLYVDDTLSDTLPDALRIWDGQLRNQDAQIRCKNGQIRDVLTSLDVIHLNGEAMVLIMATDITERKLAQRRINYLARLYATLSQVNQTIVRVKNRPELFDAICQVAVNYGEFRLAWIGLYDAASGEVTPVADYGVSTPQLLPPVFDLTQEPLRSSTLAAAVLNDRVEVNNNVQQSARSAPWRELAVQLGHHSSAAIPLHRQGQVVGVLNLYAADVNYFSVEEEQKLLSEMGVDISYALDAMYLEGQRQQAEAALRVSETRSRALIEHAPDGIVLVTPNEYIYVSPSALAMFGYSQAELFQYRPDELTHPDDLAHVFAALGELLQNPALVPTLQYRFRHHDGSWRWIESTFSNLLAEPGVEAIVINFRDVTERRQADAALRESEQKYRDLINGMNDTVMVLDFDTTILDVNRAATVVLGYTREELLSMKVTAIDGALSDDQIYDLADAMPSDQRQVFQTWHITKDGRRLPVEVSSSLVSYAGRTVIMSITRDITERQQAAEALAESEAKFRSYIEDSSVGIFVINALGQYLEVNRAAQDLLGYTADELQHMSIADVVSDEDRADAMRTYADLLTGQPLTAEYRLKQRTGQLVWVSLRATKLSNDRYIGFCSDITARKQAEAALQQSEEQYRFLVDSTSDFIARFDPTGVMVFASGAAYRFNGYLPEELIHTSAFERIHPDDQARVRNEMGHVLGGGTEGHVEYRVRRKSGDYIWVEAAGRRADNPAGEPELIVVQRDITDRKRVEEQLRQSQAQLLKFAAQVPGMLYQFEMRPDGSFCMPFTTEAIRDIFGCSPEDVRDDFSPAANVIHPDDQPKITAAIQTSARDLSPFYAEYRVVLPGQPPRWVQAHSMPEKLPNGSIVWSGFNTDVSERKAVERALAASEERHQQFIAQSFEAIYRTEFDHPIDTSLPVDEQIDLIYAYAYMAECNQAMAAMYNLASPADMIGTRLIDAHGGKDNPVNRATFEKFIKAGYKSLNDETAEFTADGQPVWFLSNTVGTVENGHLVRMWATSLDITTRKRAEAALRDSEARYRLISDNTADVIWVLDPLAGKFTYVSPSVEKLRGYTPAEVLAQPIDEVLTPESLQLVSDGLAANVLALLAQGSGTATYANEVDQPRKDGSIVHTEVTTTYLFDARGQIQIIGVSRDITERKQAEEALRRSEERFRTTLDDMLEGCQIIGFDWRYIYINEAVLRQARTTRAALLHHTMLEVYPGIEQTELFVILRDCMDNRVAHQLENEFPFPDGTFGYFELSIQPAPEGIFILSADITARKQAEAANRRTREQLAAVVEIEHALAAPLDQSAIYAALQAGVLRLFPDVTALFVSAFDAEHNLIVAVCGWHEGEVLDVATLPPIPLAPVGQGTQSHTIHTRQPLIINDDLEQRYRPGNLMVRVGNHAEGSTRSAIFVPMLVQDRVLGVIHLQSVIPNHFGEEDARALSLVANTAAASIQNARLYELAQREIVERKLRERELEAVAEVSAALRAASTSADMLAVVVDHAQNLLNGTAASIAFDLPATSEVQIVLARGHWAAITGLRVPRDSSVTGSVILSGQPYVSGDVRADGSVLRHEVLAAAPAVAVVPLTEQVGTIGTLAVGRTTPITPGEVRVVQAIADIAANALHRASIVENLEQLVVERTQKLAAANEQLTELDRLKSKFVSDVSHELRTPVTSLSLYIDLLEHGKPEKRERYVTGLKEQMGRLHKLINDILDLSRLERDQDEGNRSAVDINSIVEHVTATQLMAAEAAGLQLTCEVGDNLPAVVARPDQLTRAIANVVSNAIKYTPTGSVRVQTAEHAGRVCIEVTDTGRGIPADEVPHLFERFYRGRDVAQSTIPGTGLGLSIVKEIIESHGGTVDVQSELGQGSTFFIWLPVA